MNNLQRVRRSSSIGGSTSSLARRSSISPKDIIALQEALQKQQKISNQVVWILFLILPPFTFFLFYSISIHRGCFIETFQSLFTRSPFIFQTIPPISNTIAWKFTTVYCAIQLIFYWILPHDQALVMSSAGDEIRNINSFFSCLITCLLYVLGASTGIYGGDLVYIHFNSIVLIFSILSILTLIYLVTSYRFGCDNEITTITELYFGIEAHPKILDIDLKSFIRTRFTFIIWPLYIISSIYHQKLIYGKVSNSLYCLSVSQLFYIAKFHWNEDLYLNSLDSKRCNCGFYRLWTDFVLNPVVYTAPITVLAQSNRSLGSISNFIFSILAIFTIVASSLIDRQKYEFRKSKGELKVNGVDAFFISAKYRTDSGDSNVNLLLGSGYWAYCRHPNYLLEAVTFLVFSAFQGFPSTIAHFPMLFIIGFLVARAFTDENRCLIKYGQYWVQYCSKVKYRFLPGVY